MLTATIAGQYTSFSILTVRIRLFVRNKNSIVVSEQAFRILILRYSNNISELMKSIIRDGQDATQLIINKHVTDFSSF